MTSREDLTRLERALVEATGPSRVVLISKEPT